MSHTNPTRKRGHVLTRASLALRAGMGRCAIQVRTQPDPLAVVIDRPAELKAGTREQPVLNAALKNVDAEMRDVWIQHGGDYRSGRHARWRIHVWDSNGNLLPELPRASFIGGGLLHDGPLAFGDTWEADLP